MQAASAQMQPGSNEGDGKGAALLTARIKNAIEHRTGTAHL